MYGRVRRSRFIPNRFESTVRRLVLAAGRLVDPNATETYRSELFKQLPSADTHRGAGGTAVNAAHKWQPVAQIALDWKHRRDMRFGRVLCGGRRGRGLCGRLLRAGIARQNPMEQARRHALLFALVVTAEPSTPKGPLG